MPGLPCPFGVDCGEVQLLPVTHGGLRRKSQPCPPVFKPRPAPFAGLCPAPVLGLENGLLGHGSCRAFTAAVGGRLRSAMRRVPAKRLRQDRPDPHPFAPDGAQGFSWAYAGAHFSRVRAEMNLNGCVNDLLVLGKLIPNTVRGQGHIVGDHTERA